MKHMLIAQILRADKAMPDIDIRGWVRTRREAKELMFLEINDGSCHGNLQAVIEGPALEHDELPLVSAGASVAIRGDLEFSPASGQRFELRVRELRLLGRADPESYPLQKKRHSEEFLRSIAHLRPRTRRFGAMFRLRSKAAIAVHDFFQERAFHYLHSPVLTPSDCEGAGHMFKVSAVAAGNRIEGREFFDRPAFLTVSGQLEAEAFALALGRVYTFGPTFRAENSNTARHAAEFWMVEPEMAFCDLADDMALAEEFLVFLIRRLRNECQEDLELFFRYVDKDLENTLDKIISRPFARIAYSEAIKLLEKSGRKFEHAVSWGLDLQTEHERWLSETCFDRPVIVYDYPKDIKAFYMRVNNDARTVAAMDILFPRIGEIIGGSQREERLDVLEQRIADSGLSQELYWWYLDLRRFGTAVHSGFGLGFERFLMFLTGSGNIRDVIAFPRTPQHIEF